MVWDEACDNRTAYLDLYGSNGQTYRASASGCGRRTIFTFAFSSNLRSINLRTRACSWSCSSSAWGTLYV